ncbi:MAG: 4Fe-4S binding protein [Candidatus Geothermarchaeales archaeon]
MISIDGGTPIPFEILALLIILAGLITFISLKMRRSKTEKHYPTYDYLKINIVRWMAKSRVFRFLIQLSFVATFIFIIVGGFVGAQAPDNLSVILSWTYWWVLVIIFILFMAKIWCFLCPWIAIVNWLQRRTLWKVVKEKDVWGLHRRWPKRWANIYIATFLFILLVWLELAFKITAKPFATSMLALGFMGMVAVGLLIYRRKEFCRYACLVGRVSGLYANFSALEVRARDKEVCKKCTTKDCLNGNERGYGCPTYQLLQTMDHNTYCITCLECVKTCPYDNVAVNARPLGIDLVKSRTLRVDEAYLAIIMLALTMFHGITMIPHWDDILSSIEVIAGLGYYASFTIGMAGIILLPMGTHLIFSWASKALSGDKNIPLKNVFINYAYPLIPVAFLFHAGHNFEHILMEGQKIVPALSDPLGWGWNLFGTAAWELGPIASEWLIVWLQIFLIIVGVIYGVWITCKRSKKIFNDDGQALRSVIPIVMCVLLSSIVNLWLLSQPMVLRTAM